MEEHYNYKRSGQIPRFGDWQYTGELPITQYFECARQAGLVVPEPYSSSSGECRPHVNGVSYGDFGLQTRPSAPNFAPSKMTRRREKRQMHVKEQRKQSRICDVTEPPRSHRHCHVSRGVVNVKEVSHLQDNAVAYPRPSRAAVGPPKPKPVDEDLYRISPDLLHATKRKKMLGFIPRCLVPACSG